MKPILITLLFIPPILFVVTLGHLWWHRISKSPVKAYRVQFLLFWALVALGPVSLWYVARLDHTYYFFWALVAVQWIVGVVRGIPALRDCRRRLNSNE